jgi:hypothetical protein
MQICSLIGLSVTPASQIPQDGRSSAKNLPTLGGFPMGSFRRLALRHLLQICRRYIAPIGAMSSRGTGPFSHAATQKGPLSLFKRDQPFSVLP